MSACQIDFLRVAASSNRAIDSDARQALLALAGARHRERWVA